MVVMLNKLDLDVSSFGCIY